MARWYLSSEEKSAREAALVCERAGLRSSGQMAGVNCHGQAYSKRAVVTPNLVKFGEGDWICCAGTIIYGAQMGSEALSQVYADFTAGGIAAVRQKAIGHYALAIRHGSSLDIFTDTQGALNLYYFNEAEFWFVSNSLSLCAKTLPVRKVDEAKLLVTIFQTNTPGEDTFYPGVKRLFGTQQIHIDLASRMFRVETVPPPAPVKSWRLSSIDTAIAQYLIEVRRIFASIGSVGSIALLGTGGLDSRTILAALLDQKVAPQILYAIGNSRLTDYDFRDLNIVKHITRLYRLPFQKLDWAGNQPHNRTLLQDLFSTYGFKYEIYGATDGFLRVLNDGLSHYPKLFLGGYGPAFTNSKPWNLQKRSFSFDDLVNDAMAGVNRMELATFKTDYRSVFAREARVGLRRGGIDFPDEGASLQAFVQAKLFLYIRAESRFLNLVNDFRPYIAPFLMKDLHDPLVSIPMEFRAKDEFQIRLIHALAPGLLDVPLYSGLAPATIDRQAFHLVREEGGRKPSFLGRLARIFLPPGLREILRKRYVRLKKRIWASRDQLAGRDRKIVAAYSQQVMNDVHARRWFKSTVELTPKILARVHHYLIGVESLGYSEWINTTGFF